MPRRFIPFFRTPITIAPITVPAIVPRPPFILVPPRTTAEIASISAPSPNVIIAVNVRPTVRIPARDASKALYINTKNVTYFTLIPEYSAA